MANHTPGPWIAIHDYDKNFVEPVNQTPHGDYIAYCSGQGDIDIDGALANSILIAAAPDLLAACEAALPWIASQIEYPGDPCEKIANGLRTAIGKANAAL